MTGQLRFVSFFSGILGLDLGFEAAGWQCVCANEIDPTACETIRINRPDLRLYQEDIRDLTTERILGDAGLEPGAVDAVVGGPPCQAFSTAGKRRSLDDDRGSLALHYLQLATAIQPRWIVLENVRGLLSAPLSHRPHAQRGPGFPPLSADELHGGALARVREYLLGAGYRPTWRLYDASRYGAAQRRERLVIIAARDGHEVPHVAPLNRPEDAPTFRHVTAGLKSTEWAPLRPVQLKFLPLLGPGQNWRDLPEALQQEAIGGAFFASGGRVGFLRRVAWDEPCPTLVTSPTMPATLLAHPEELRPLSVEEYRRVQGFPDEWRICGSTASKYRQIGNAVPVALGRAIAQHLASPSTTSGSFATSRYRGDTERDWERQYLVTQQSLTPLAS